MRIVLVAVLATLPLAAGCNGGSRELWRAQIHSSHPNVAVGADGSTYLADTRGVEAIGPDGLSRWREQTSQAGSIFPAGLQISPANDVFVAASGLLSCYGPDGEIRWQREEEFGDTGHLIIHDDQLRLRTTKALRSYSFDGKLRGSVDLPAIVTSGPQFDSNGRAYFTSMVSDNWNLPVAEYDSWLVAAEPGKGVLWKQQLELVVGAGTDLDVDAEDIVTVTTRKGAVRFSAKGDLLPAGDALPRLQQLTTEDGGRIVLRLTVAGHWLERLGDDGGLVWGKQFDSTDAKVSHVRGLELVEERLYVLVQEHVRTRELSRILCLDSTSGKQLWTWNCGELLGGLTAAPDGSLRVVTQPREGQAMLFALKP